MNPTELGQATQKRAGIGAAGVDGQSFRLLFPAALKWPEINRKIAGQRVVDSLNRLDIQGAVLLLDELVNNQMTAPIPGVDCAVPYSLRGSKWCSLISRVGFQP